MKVLCFAGRAVLASIWLLAAATKTTALDELAEMIKVIFPMVGNGGLIVALLLIATEALIGLSLLFRRTSELGIKLSICVSMAFLAVNVIRYQANLGVPCSCFGPIYKLGPAPMAFLDLSLIGLSAALLRAGGGVFDEKNFIAA
jgi:hypothetical protein